MLRLAGVTVRLFLWKYSCSELSDVPVPSTKISYDPLGALFETFHLAEKVPLTFEAKVELKTNDPTGFLTIRFMLLPGQIPPPEMSTVSVR